MKNLIFLLLIILFAGCTKEGARNKTFGADAIGNTDNIQVITSQSFANRGKPVKNPPVTDTTPTPIILPPAPTLPASWSLNMQYVVNQGSEGSCNAQNVCYARSYLAGVKLSPEFLFNQGKTNNTCSGSALITNLNITRDSGICTWSTMPYDWTNGCSLQPNDFQKAEAQQYRIKSYQMIYANDITAIKIMIAANRPLVFQITADQQFLDATAGFIWKSFTTAVSGHGITLVGYDDSKNAYKILNSWGTSWGDAGFSWIDYSFFPSVSSNLFVMNL